MTHSRANRVACLAALVAGCLLVACAEEDAGPQFATDPRPTRAPTEAAASPPPALLPTAEASRLRLRSPICLPFAARHRSSTLSRATMSGQSRVTGKRHNASRRRVVLRSSPLIRHLMGKRLPSSWRLVQADGKHHKSSSSTPRDRLWTASTHQSGPRRRQLRAMQALSKRSTGHRKGTGSSPNSQPAKSSTSSIDAPEAPVTLDFAEAAGTVIEPAWSPTGQKYCVHFRERRRRDTFPANTRHHDRRNHDPGHPACRATRRRLCLVA